MKNLKKTLKIVMITLLSILLIFVITIGSLNALKYAIYNEYYSITTEVCKNPGLNEGAVPQGVAVSEDEGLILTTAYMTDKSASRIYLTNSKNESRCILLMQNGKPFLGHVGGISLSGNLAYIANDHRIYPIDLDDIKTKDKIEIGEGILVNNQASFTFADSNYLYVGEFHYGPYVCENKIDDNNAIVTKYSLADLTKPLAIYSVGDKVQGFCMKPDGTIILSTSWSVSDSKLYVYEKDRIVLSGEYDGVPLYKLKNPTKVIKAPAMTEDLSYANGKVYTLFESACNKYIFGKLFFAFEIVGMEI